MPRIFTSKDLCAGRIHLTPIEEERLREINAMMDSPNQLLGLETLNIPPFHPDSQFLGLPKVRSFCEELAGNVKELKDDFEQVFFHFYNLVTIQKDQGFKLKDQAILIMKERGLLLITFGQASYADAILNLTQQKATFFFFFSSANEIINMDFKSHLVPFLKGGYERRVLEVMQGHVRMLGQQNQKAKDEIQRKLKEIVEKDHRLEQECGRLLRLIEEERVRFGQKEKDLQDTINYYYRRQIAAQAKAPTLSLQANPAFLKPGFRLRPLKDNQLLEIFRWIHPEKSLAISTLQKYEVPIICYGPVLNILHLKSFCDELTAKVRQFKEDQDQIFSQICAFLLTRKGYKLKDQAVLIVKHPHCALVAFGEVSHVHFAINLDKEMAYVMGDSEHFDIPFHPEIARFLEEIFVSSFRMALSSHISGISNHTTELKIKCQNTKKAHIEEEFKSLLEIKKIEEEREREMKSFQKAVNPLLEALSKGEGIKAQIGAELSASSGGSW